MDLADEVDHDFRLTVRVRRPGLTTRSPRVKDDRSPEAPGVHTTPASGASGRSPTGRPATRSSRTSCCTGSRRRCRKASLDVVVLVLARHRRRRRSLPPDPLRAAAAVPLRAVGRAGLPVVKDIEFVVTFGSWIRSVHRIAAHLMVVVVFLHIVRVFLTGAYKNGIGRGQRREWNWVIGVGMLLADAVPVVHRLPAAVGPARRTGRSRSAPTSLRRVPWVGRRVRELLIGGRTIEQATLIRFYVLHSSSCRAVWACCSPTTCGACRKDGGLARADRDRCSAAAADVPPVATKTYTLLGVARGSAGRPMCGDVNRGAGHHGQCRARPDAPRRDRRLLGTIAVVSILAVFIRSPLEEPANALRHAESGQGSLVHSCGCRRSSPTPPSTSAHSR